MSTSRWPVVKKFSKLQLVLFVFVLLLLISVVLRAHLHGLVSEKIVDSFDDLGSSVAISDLSLTFLSPTIGVTIDEVWVNHPDSIKQSIVSNAEIVVSTDWWGILRRESRVGQVFVKSMHLDAIIDEGGTSPWLDLFERFQSMPAQESMVIDEIVLEKMTLQYTNSSLNQSGSIALSGNLLSSNVFGKSHLSGTGQFNEIPLKLDLHRNSTADPVRSDLPYKLDLQLSVAESSLLMNTALDSMELPTNGSMHIELIGKQLQNIYSQLSLSSNYVSSASLLADVELNDGEFVANDINLKTDQSELSGELRYTSASSEDAKRRLHASFLSKKLDLNELGAIYNLFSLDPIESNINDPDEIAENEAQKPLSIIDSVKNFDIDINGSFASIQKNGLQINDTTISASKVDTIAKVVVESPDFAKGLFNNTISMTISEGLLQGNLTSRVEKVEIADVIAGMAEESSQVSGRVSGQSRFWFSGASTMELVASIDGGLFLMLHEGKLDSLLVEMVGIDLMESIWLVAERDFQTTDIRCGFLDVQSENGIFTLEDFILDTEDSIFTASGTVDLIDEKVNIKFTPLPRDASFLAATTPVIIKGSLASPTVRPGKKLYTRFALAAAMAALAGPAAIVVPFIQMGSGEESSHCAELFSFENN